MDGDDPATGGRAGRGDVPFAGDDLATRRRPDQRGVHVSLQRGGVIGPVDHAEALVQQSGRLARVLRSEFLARAAAQKSERLGRAAAGSRTHIRQSALYSQHKRRSGQKRGVQSSTLPVKEHADDVGSSKLGSTNKDLSKIEALSLDDSPHASGSTDGVMVHAGNTGSDGPDSTFAQLSALEEAVSPSLAVVCAGDMGSGEHDSSTVGPSGLEEASPSLSEELRELEEYLSTHTFSSFEDAFRYVLSVQRAAFPGVPIAEDEILSHQFEDEAFELTTPDQSVPVQVPTFEASVGIVQNGNKWMGEEVMAAFEKYIGKRDNLKDFEYKLDELCRQCFNVKNYNHMFHHFNFSVKTKAPGSTVWTSALYFAEVKTIFRQKVYFCCPLEPNENGYCYACKNQGMDDLKHPMIGAFDRGDKDTTFPYMYMSESECPYMCVSESDDDIPSRLEDSDDETTFDDGFW